VIGRCAGLAINVECNEFPRRFKISLGHTEWRHDRSMRHARAIFHQWPDLI
jgi:hypothetical protein